MSTELSEAILAANGASALVQKEISPLVLELQRRYSPLVRVLPAERISTTVYNFDTRTNIPTGGFVTDGGARQLSSSTYNQTGFTIKNLQVVGGVTGYAEAVTSSFGSLRGREIQGAGKGLNWDVENGLIYGNSAATAPGPYPQFDGLQHFLQDTTSSAPNTFNYANGTFDTGVFDRMIEMVESNAAVYPGDQAEYIFLVSTTVSSKVDQLHQSMQEFIRQVGVGAIGTSEVAAGLRVKTYRDIPIVKSSFLNPRSNQMGTVTATTASTGGFLPQSTTYKYQVSAIIARFGEINASAEVSQAIGATGTATNIITLSFSAPSVTAMNQVLSPTHYKVWRTAGGGGSGTETLLGVVDAAVGLSADGITPIFANQIVDTGQALIPQQSSGSVVPATLLTTYVDGNSALTPLGWNGASYVGGQQELYLLPLDPEFILRPYVREMQTVDVYPTVASPDALPYAFVEDTVLAFRNPAFAARATNVQTALAA